MLIVDSIGVEVNPGDVVAYVGKRRMKFAVVKSIKLVKQKMFNGEMRTSVRAHVHPVQIPPNSNFAARAGHNHFCLRNFERVLVLKNIVVK